MKFFPVSHRLPSRYSFCSTNPPGSFEILEALDVEQFNKDMTALEKGERVAMPTYNFKTGKREYKGDTMQLGGDDFASVHLIHKAERN